MPRKGAHILAQSTSSFWARNPLLGKAGVAATLTRQSRSFLWVSGRGGSFDFGLVGGLNDPPRLRELRRLREILMDRAATPPLPRGVALPEDCVKYVIALASGCSGRYPRLTASAVNAIVLV